VSREFHLRNCILGHSPYLNPLSGSALVFRVRGMRRAEQLVSRVHGCSHVVGVVALHPNVLHAGRVSVAHIGPTEYRESWLSAPRKYAPLA